MKDHTTHGRGDVESGPEESDCACRATADQDDCSRAGCGFCRAQRQEDKMMTFAPPPGWERRMVDGRFRLVKCDANRQRSMPDNFGTPETAIARGNRMHREVEARLRENTKCSGGCPTVDRDKLGPPVAHNPAFDLGALSSFPEIRGYMDFISSEMGAEMRIRADSVKWLEENPDPRDYDEGEPLIAHGAGPTAPRRRRRRNPYCK